MVEGVESIEVIEADVVELIHKVRYLSLLDVEKDLFDRYIDFLHRPLQTSSPVFFESTTTLWLSLFSCSGTGLRT